MSDVTAAGTAGKLIPAICSAGLASCFTGLDLFSLLGALGGMSMAMIKQERTPLPALLINACGLVIFAICATWFVADAWSFGMARMFSLHNFELERGRALVAFLLAYFAQDLVLPKMGGVLGRVLGGMGRGRDPS